MAIYMLEIQKCFLRENYYYVLHLLSVLTGYFYLILVQACGYRGSIIIMEGQRVQLTILLSVLARKHL